MRGGLTLIEIPATAKTVEQLHARWLRYRRLADACAHSSARDAPICRQQYAAAREAYEDYYEAKAGRQAAIDEAMNEVLDWFDPPPPRKAIIDPAPGALGRRGTSRLRRLLAWLRGPWIADDPTERGCHR